MLKKVLLPTILIILAYGFWVSPDFKEIAAGVSIFLFGMLSLEEGFQAFTGGILEKVLKRTTNRLWKSLTFGIVTTTLMQSSSLISLITISFLSAGLIDLGAGIGIVFGANLGTTTGAWLVAGLGLKVKISAYAMPMLVFGAVAMFQKSTLLKGIGHILAGLGFLFLGIHHMKEGFESFRQTFDLAEYGVAGYPGVFLFTAIGIAATVVMQSSHATLVLIITALAAGQITYANALALAIGANVGTTITAIIGSMSANAQGKRLAGAHLIFKVVTGLIAIAFIHQFVGVVNWVSARIGIAGDDYTLKLAVFHTLFNLVGIVVMIPFVNTLVRFLTGLIRTRALSVAEPKYLDPAAADFPDTALEAVRNETGHVYENARDIMARGLGFTITDITQYADLERVAKAQTRADRFDIDPAYETSVKNLYGAIITFISRAPFTWEMEQSGRLHWLRRANQNIVEAIKDIKHMQKNLMRYIVSENQEIRDEYNRLRVQIGVLMQKIEKIRTDERPDAGPESIIALKMGHDEEGDAFNEVLAALIRKNRITPQMATSLMNDRAYARDITRNLIEMIQTLVICRENRATKSSDPEPPPVEPEPAEGRE